MTTSIASIVTESEWRQRLAFDVPQTGAANYLFGFASFKAKLAFYGEVCLRPYEDETKAVAIAYKEVF
ncbi:hypothetical protein [Herbaspirillum seropedicae]|uniref:hypothetical protein n=1 Tax=Herbaspirillum seropedicae TaxID=964 RepID=UPI003FCD9334